jgi:hypothetical protein
MAAPKRTRGPATGKHYRKPATGKTHAERVEFGKTWGAFNSEAAKRLREGNR